MTRLLRPREHGKPYQGAVARLVRRPHQLPSLVAEPVPPAVVVAGLQLVGSAPPPGPPSHRARQSTGRYDSLETAQVRCRCLTQYTARSLAALGKLSEPLSILQSRCSIVTELSSLVPDTPPVETTTGSTRLKSGHALNSLLSCGKTACTAPSTIALSFRDRVTETRNDDNRHETTYS